MTLGLGIRDLYKIRYDLVHKDMDKQLIGKLNNRGGNND